MITEGDFADDAAEEILTAVGEMCKHDVATIIRKHSKATKGAVRTMNWLDLARAGENCPQATERSFSARERAKWERAAEYTNRSGGTAPGCEPGDLPDYPGVTAGKDEHDRAREREAKEYPPLPPWPRRLCFPDGTWSSRVEARAGLAGDWGEIEPALRARDERIAALERSLRIHVKLYTDSHSVEFEQRDQIASLEAENARLRAALRGLLDTGWHRDYGYMDPACDAPNGGECSCGLTNAKESARSALEAGR